MNNIDLTALPPNAKQELIDFYQFLLSKYTGVNKETAIKIPNEFYESASIAPRLVKPFTPLNREEVYE